MQKPLAIAAVMGALIIAVALVYHGRQLAEVSRRLEAMEQRVGGYFGMGDVTRHRADGDGKHCYDNSAPRAEVECGGNGA